jgi:hypothetical protein
VLLLAADPPKPAHNGFHVDGSLVVSILALLFTVGSFYWIQARQGRLRLFAPHSFAAAVQDSAVLFIRLPLVMYNTGAKPIVVQNLRLLFPDVTSAALPLPWRTSRAELKPHHEDGAEFPAVFSVKGREAAQYFIEFGGPFPGFVLEAKPYRVRVEATMGHRVGWRPMLDFILHADRIAFPENYITYSNEPLDRSNAQLARNEAALRKMMEKVEAARMAGSNLPPDDPTTLY